MKVRRGIFYGGFILLAVVSIISILFNSGLYNAQVIDPCATPLQGIASPNTDCMGTGGGYTDCATLTQQISLGIVGTAKAAELAAPGSNSCACSEGDEPRPVPQSVEDAKAASLKTILPLPGEISEIKNKTTIDVVDGSVKELYYGSWSKVYDTQAAGESAIKLDYTRYYNTYFRPSYFDTIWYKVDTHGYQAFTAGKGYFSYPYSTSPDKWGPTVSYNTSLYNNGNASLSLTSTMGGFSYNYQPLDAGYVKTNILGLWKISGDNLYATAGYDCIIGEATGNVSFRHEFTGLKINWDVPFYYKDPLNSGKAKLAKVSFGITVIDKKARPTAMLTWKIK